MFSKARKITASELKELNFSTKKKAVKADEVFSNLFNPKQNKLKSTSVANMCQIFANCSLLTTVDPNLCRQNPGLSLFDFKSATSIANYADIPLDWK